MPLIRNNPVAYLLSRTWKFSEGNRFQLSFAYASFIIANVVGLLQPLLIAHIMNLVQVDGVTKSNISWLLILTSGILVINTIFWLFHGPARVMELRNSYLIRVNYRRYLVEGVMGLPLQWHSQHHSGATIDRIEKGSSKLSDFASDGFELFESVVRLVGSYIILLWFHVHSGYIVLVVSLASFMVVIKIDKFLKKKHREVYDAENAASAKVFDALSNITTVVILRIENLLSKEIVKTLLKPLKTYVLKTKVSEMKWFIVSTLANLTTVLVIGSYLYTTYRSGAVILVGSVYLLYGYVDNITNIYYRFAYKYSEFIRQKAAIESAEEIASLFSKKQRLKDSSLGSWNVIDVKNLNFSYEGKRHEHRHLQDVSLSLHRRERVAFVGESGSGKTTTLKLLRALYDPDGGSVFLDGKTTSFKFLSEHITLIPQEAEIFNTTIGKNITMGVSHSEEVIIKASKMARFHHVAMRLPRKYLSLIQEKGVNLSGGEKQRLALSRGLLATADKPILLMDEPTSSIDSKNELEIYKNIFREYGKKTIVSTVHRLHLLHLFDKIYYFKCGKIIASGSFRDLLKNDDFKMVWEKYRESKKDSKEPHDTRWKLQEDL